MPQRIFSGMRPTGKLHIGHWLGTLNNWVRLQNEYECLYGIVDWHALTTEYANVAGIAGNVIEVATDWLAAGLDPKRSLLMIQSLVPEHAELHLIFSMIVPTPWLERVPTYKEQREVARRFNGFYRPLFPEPQAMLSETPKVVGTDGRKMSKSYGNTIALSDSPSEVHKKVMSMMTDPQRTHRNIPGNPDVCPVYLNHQSFTNADEVAQINQACRTAAMGCVDCKKTLSASLERAMSPIYAKRKEWERRPDEVRDVLIDGSKRAGEIAKCTMTEVRKAVNIYYGRE
ncbi:MAG: tryptophan--tRNA ligase [Acidobacteria bacterium]|nr:tryptophan--tRNA ligase [Acidobacteriota bacterium]